MVLAFGCTADRAEEEAVDLMGRISVAEIVVATRGIDFGAPVGLSSGWSVRANDSDGGEDFMWGIGEGSTVDFQVIKPRDLKLSFRCRAIRRAGMPPQEVTLGVNGVEIETLTLSPGIVEYESVLPASALQEGRNTLELGYAIHREVGENSRIPLAVAWYDLGWNQGENGAPRVDENGRLLFVPFDSAVHFPVLAHPGSEVALGPWSSRGEGEGELELRVQVDGQEPKVLAILSGEESKEKRWKLDVEGPARLSLVARELGDDLHGGAFALEGLRLLFQPPEPPEATASTPTLDGGAPSMPPNMPPNMIVYLVDTLRADRLGAYGAPTPPTGSLTPHLDRFAEEGVVFERTVAQSSWTRSAVASLLTGLWPGNHGAVGRRDRLPSEALTLGERLAEAGYETVAVLTNPNVSGNFGFRQGFEHYIHLPKQADSVQVNAEVARWLESYDGSRPFFLYIHTADPHTPYLPPEPYRSKIAADSEPVRRQIEYQRRKQNWDPDPETIRQLYALYDAEIAFNDDSFGVLIEMLKEKGLYDDLFFTFISDHGEEFYEHGAWTHGNNLHNDGLDVPFVAKFPGGPSGLRVAERVQQADLVPTALELAGLPAAEGLDGYSLLPLLSGESQRKLGAWGERPVFAHLQLDGPLYLAIEEENFKVVQRIVDGSDVQTYLFDVSVDPLERVNLASERPITVEYLVSRLKEKTRQRSDFMAEQALVDEELARELRALGYVP